MRLRPFAVSARARRPAPDGRRIVFVDHRLWNDDLGQVRMIDADGKVRTAVVR